MQHVYMLRRILFSLSLLDFTSLIHLYLISFLVGLLDMLNYITFLAVLYFLLITKTFHQNQLSPYSLPSQFS